MNNEKGSILISLLLVVIVLSILSIGVYRISYSASRQAEFTRDNTQAYYIAKAGADLVIDDIENIVEEMGDSNEKDFKIDFDNGDKADITIKYDANSRKAIINSMGIVNENKLKASRNSIQATLEFNLNHGNLAMLGIGNDGIIYEIDLDFKKAEKFDIRDSNGREIKISDPRAFDWNGIDTLVLVGGESGKGKNKEETLIYNLSKEEGITLATGGNGFRYVVRSEYDNKFYAIRTNNDKINYLECLNKNKEWKDIHKPKGNFVLEKLAQGNNIIIGISAGEKSTVAYLEDISADSNNKDWININTKIDGTYNSIAYGKKDGYTKGYFVIVGKDNHNRPLILHSQNGIEWKDFTDDSTNGVLNDVIWSGEKFIAVGENAIYVSIMGNTDDIEWTKIEYSQRDSNYIMVSAFEDYIVAYRKNGALISKNGGETWNIVTNQTIPRLKDIIVVNTGTDNDKPDFTNPTIQWSK